MKINPRDADRFVQRPDAAIAVVLLYGPDTGLVKERAQTLAAAVLGDPVDPFALASVSLQQVLEDAGLLAAERSAISFGGGRRVIRVADAGDRISGAVEAACKAPGDGVIVLEAGELSPRSKLRKVCEASATSAAIACYSDDDRALGTMIDKTLGDQGLTIDPAARQYLVENMGNDRLVSRGEIEKLVLYMGSGDGRTAQISLADVQACVFDNDLKDLGDLSSAVAQGNMQQVMDVFATTLQDGMHPVAVLRGMQRYFQRLHVVVDHADRGSSVERAVEGLRPPVFFKEKPDFIRAAKRFSGEKIAVALDVLTDAEKACKSGKGPDVSICERALLRLAQLGR